MLSPSFYPELKEFEDILLESNMEMFANDFSFENPGLEWLNSDNKDDFEFFPPGKHSIDLENDAGSSSSSDSSLSENRVSVETLLNNELNNGVINKKGNSDKRDEAYFREETLGKRLRKSRDQRPPSGKRAPYALHGRSRRDVEDEEEDLILNCESGQGLSKNAIAARENRQRKKKYVQGLELSVKSLGEDNHKLRIRNDGLEHAVDELQNEVSYLRSVLENVDEIASLVESIRSVNNRSNNNFNSFINQHDYSKSPSSVNNVSSGENVNKRKAVVDINKKTSCGKRVKKGVCIHLDNGRMSLEFCPRCSGSANESWSKKSN